MEICPAKNGWCPSKNRFDRTTWPAPAGKLFQALPSKLLSDNGTQLVAANKELSNISKKWDWKHLKCFGVTEGFEWIFTSADAPWQNGITEALIRSVKRAINASIGDSILILIFILIRGQWKLGKVSNTHPGTDGKVRKVDVQYKNLNADEPTTKYKGKGYITVQRPVQRLILLLPIDEQWVNSQFT